MVEEMQYIHFYKVNNNNNNNNNKALEKGVKYVQS